MAYELDLLCARLVNLGYQPGFLFAARATDLSAFPGRSLVSVIWGVDPDVGKIAYGLLTDGPEGLIASIRGTQVPLESMVEWVRDFEAELVPCPFVSGALWHDGIGKDYLTLTLDDGTPVGKGLSGAKGLTVAGHSKGGPLAVYLATEAGLLGGNAPACVAFAPCKPGDKAFGKAAVSATSSIHLWANPKDIVPHTPLTITNLPAPFINEDYEFPVPLSPLDPSSVTPPVATDWDSAHNLAGCYIRLLEALP